MSSFVVWVDSEHAKIFKFLPGKIEPSTLKRSDPVHHTHSTREDHVPEQFFQQIAQHLEPATEVLIVGPGIAKTQFKTHLDKHHPILAKKVEGVETMDHPTDAQIVASARKSLHAIHLFKGL